LAECGKGWTGRCSAAKSKRCKCRCGGANHGATRQKFEDDSPRRSTDEEMYYGYDEKKRRAFTPMAATVVKVKFTRIAGEPSFPDPSIPQRGKPVVELVFLDHQEKLQHRYMRHSPDGFEWGYGGSGPAELAMNLLAEFVGIKNATELGYQDFKFDFIAKISQEEGGEISGDEIVRWVRDRWADMAVKEQEAAERGS
jgi:hypothetical protein